VARDCPRLGTAPPSYTPAHPAAKQSIRATRPYWRNDGTGGVAADETDRLISCDKVEGTPVYNLKGERLGKVHHLMIDKYTGQVAYAVMSLGGLLGIGEKYQKLCERNG